ncbi:MAG TPA: AAA family ATPase, partial [Actinomycetota bacterium]
KFLYDQEKGTKDAVKHHARMLAREAMGLSTWKQQKIDVGRRTTIVVDECSMADNEKLAKVLDCAEKKGCRVVLIGDQRQLPAIGQGGLFREIHDRATPEAKAELTEI